MAHLAAGSSSIDHIALLGNYLPRKCGLATYTTDTYLAMKARFPDLRIDVYAMDDHPGRYAYPPEVTRAIPQDERTAYSDRTTQAVAYVETRDVDPRTFWQLRLRKTF